MAVVNSSFVDEKAPGEGLGLAAAGLSSLLQRAVD